MKRSILALAGVLALAATAMPALAAMSLDVPLVATAPSLDPHATSAFNGSATAQLVSYNNQSNAADEPATVRLLSDGKALYVRFDVTQRYEPLEGLDGGDSVAVDFWSGGDRYHLGVGLNGAHTSDSTPNTTDWATAVATRSGGYTATIKVPQDVATGAHAQFSRWISSAGELQVWSHDASAPAADELAQAGTLTFASSVGKN